MNKFVKKLWMLGLVLLLAAAPAQPLLPTARAVTQSDIDGLKEDKKGLNKEKKEIEDQLAQLRNDKATAIQRRTLLDQKIDLTVKEIAATEAEIADHLLPGMTEKSSRDDISLAYFIVQDREMLREAYDNIDTPFKPSAEGTSEKP